MQIITFAKTASEAEASKAKQYMSLSLSERLWIVKIYALNGELHSMLDIYWPAGICCHTEMS